MHSARETAQTRTLRRALETYTEPGLAKALGVPVEDLSRWLFGNAVLPVEVYMNALTLVAGKKRRGASNRQ